jgi:hypothetical protein
VYDPANHSYLQTVAEVKTFPSGPNGTRGARLGTHGVRLGTHGVRPVT